MDPLQIFILIAMPGLLACSAVLSASETALFSLTYHDRLRLRKVSPAAEGIAAALLDQPRRLLITILLGNNAVNVMYFILLSVLVMRAESAWGGVAVNAGGLIAIILLGEVFPKVLAGSTRVTAARLLAPPLFVLHRALGPVRAGLARWVIDPLTRLVTPEHADERVSLTVEELSRLVELGGRQGTLDVQEQRLLAQVVQLGMWRVWDVMTPRVEMAWVEASAAPADVARLVRASRRTRLPVRAREGEEAVLGMLNVKRYLAAAGQRGREIRVLDYTDPARYVPAAARLDQLLEEFRRQATHVAIAVNEHGAVAGIVEIENVVERLVAEIATAGQSGEVGEEDVVRMVGIGQWEAPGRLSVREWAQMFGQEADPRVTTIAGLIQAATGRVPAPGDAVTLGNVRLEVASVDGNAVDRVLISLVARAAGQDGTGRENGGGR